MAKDRNFLTDAFVVRISKAIRWVERQYRNTLPPTKGRGGGRGGKWEHAKLDEALDGGAGENVECTIVRLKYDKSLDEWSWEETDRKEDVYAPYTLSVGRTLAADTKVRIAKHRDGKWYVANASCEG